MRYVGAWARLFAFSLFSLTLISCQNFDVESGLPTASPFTASSTSDYPGVVKIYGVGGMCTGTIVSHKAVLTAAHCTLERGTYTVTGDFGSAKSTTIVENFGPGEVNDPNDIALLIFPNNTFDQRYVVRIASSVSSGDTATLVGYGCDDLTSRTGSGVKRSGTNQIARISSYVYFYTPVSSSYYRGIVGPSNRAASCFGDSGGPALKQVNGSYEVVAVTHAGGVSGSTIISQYVNVASDSYNRNFIAGVNRDYNLGIQGF